MSDLKFDSKAEALKNYIFSKKQFTNQIRQKDKRITNISDSYKDREEFMKIFHFSNSSNSSNIPNDIRLMNGKARIQIKCPFTKAIKNSWINKGIQAINQIKNYLNSNKNQLQVEKIVKISHQLNIAVNRNHFLNPDYFVKKLQINQIMQRLLLLLFSIIIRENNIMPYSEINPKYFLSNRNNPDIIIKIMKKRNWWSIFQGKELYKTINLFWTECIVYNVEELDSFNRVVCLNPLSKNEQVEIFYKKHVNINYENNEQFHNQNQEFNNLEIIENSRDNNQQKCQIFNHIEGNHQLGDKKSLFLNINKYLNRKNENVLNYIPMTFLIEGLYDEQFTKFQNFFEKIEQDKLCINDLVNKEKQKSRNVWIIKPGENSNRGN